jgi:hypothetical protein
MSNSIVPFGKQPDNHPPKTWIQRRRALKAILMQPSVTASDISNIIGLVFCETAKLRQNGLPFSKAILYVTATKNRNGAVAYKQFCSYHADVYGWDPSQHRVGPGVPDAHWGYWDLINHRAGYTFWRVKQACDALEAVKEKNFRKKATEDRKTA